MKRRCLLKSAIFLPSLFSLGKYGYGEAMTKERTNFIIEEFGAPFSTVVDPYFSIRQDQPYNMRIAPVITFYNQEEGLDAFFVRIWCFTADFYTGAQNLAMAMAGRDKGRDIQIERDSVGFGYARLSYISTHKHNRPTNIHCFKNLNHFVIFHVYHNDDEAYKNRYKPYEEKLINNFTFDNPGDNSSQVTIEKLDSRSTILLPYDWHYRDVTVKVRELLDPKMTLTRAYYFEHKMRRQVMGRPLLPYITLAHYQDNISEMRYLIDAYKEYIESLYSDSDDSERVVFDNAELMTVRRDDDTISMLILIIKLRDADNQSLPMEIRATLFESPSTDGCYMVYSTNATVTDSRILAIKVDENFAIWMMIDMMGEGMANLLAHSLGRGLDDYPHMFDHKFSSD